MVMVTVRTSPFHHRVSDPTLWAGVRWRKTRCAEAGVQLDLFPQTLKEPRKRQRVLAVSRLAAVRLPLPQAPSHRSAQPKGPFPLGAFFFVKS